MRAIISVGSLAMVTAAFLAGTPANASYLTTLAQARPIGRLRAAVPAPWPWMQAAPRPRSLPVLYPIDQASDTIVVGNTVPGSRIDIFANGRWIATGVAQRYAARLFLQSPLTPGVRVVAAERSQSGELFSRDSTVGVNYTTYHQNNFRTGWNPYETSLTTTNVASSSFGELFTVNLDGETLAQPLIVNQVNMPGLGVHDTLFTVTENDTVYAFDAESGAPLWTSSLVNPNAGITPVPIDNIGNCKNIEPTIGITSTPVIDTTTGTMYVDAKLKEVVGGVTSFHHMLHAIDIATGLDKTGSPVDVTATFPMIGGGTLTFDPQWEHQRPGLLLYRGVVYVGYGSHCDFEGPDAHGWLLGYTEDTLKQVSVFNGSPNNGNGFSSIWGGGFAPAADYQGSIFFATGNGYFDGQGNFGDSVLRLDSTTLHLRDYFAPYNQAYLNEQDFDLGSGGVMLIPQTYGSAPELLVEAGKDKTIYLMSASSLGGYTLGGPDNVLQSIPNGAGLNLGVEGGPAYYVGSNGTPYVFYGGGQDHLKAWALTMSPTPMLTLSTQSRITLTGEGGTVPVVSSNGQLAHTGIVWCVFRPQQGGPDHDVVLAAYDASNLLSKLLFTTVGVFGNPKGNLFSVPTVINGRVYVSNGNQIVTYGLL